MSDLSKPEFNNPNNPSEDSTVEHAAVPHSGDAGIEFPVKDFDKTTLQQAVSEGLITTPDDPSSITSHAVPDAEAFGTEPKKGRGKLIAGVSTVLAAGLGIGAFTMFGSKEAGDSSPEVTAPTATTPAIIEKSLTQEELAAKYPNLTYKEARLLNRLVQYGYPDKVKDFYEFNGYNTKQILLDYATALSAIVNTHNYDTYAQMYGYKEFEGEFVTTRFPNNGFTLDELDAFYVPNPNNIKFKPCTTEGDYVSCEGYVELYTFYRNDDPDSEYVDDMINHRLENEPPNNGNRIYLILKPQIDTRNYIIYDSFEHFSYDEPTTYN